MSDIKFECPTCGQHLECNRACGGDVIHCPRCCAEIRVPFSGFQEIEGSVTRAELISQPAATTPSLAHPAKAGDDQLKQPAATPDHPTEVMCPVCQADLRIRSGLAAKVGGKLPVAELIRQGPAQPKDAEPAKASKPLEPHPAHPTVEEREQQIAAAREAHPVQLYPPMKPRLDYVLSGEVPPAASEDSASKTPKPREPDQDNPPTKSLNE